MTLWTDRPSPPAGGHGHPSDAGRFLNLIADATFVLDARQRLVALNDSAHHFLGREYLTLSGDGKIVFCDVAAQRYLSAGIATVKAAKSGAAPSKYILHSEQRRLLLTILPMPGGADHHEEPVEDDKDDCRPLVVLVLKDLDGQAPQNMCAVRQMFGLTAAESKLAEAMARGCTIQHYADVNKLSFFTVRNQLTCVFAKTGTSRQVELALLLNRIAG